MSFRVLTKTGSAKKDAQEESRLGAISFNQWIQAEYEAQREKEDQPPSSGITVDQFAKKFQFHRATASTKLNALVKRGLAKRVPCRRLCGAAGIKIVPYFVLLEAERASGQRRTPIREEAV